MSTLWHVTRTCFERCFPPFGVAFFASANQLRGLRFGTHTHNLRMRSCPYMCHQHGIGTSYYPFDVFTSVRPPSSSCVLNRIPAVFGSATANHGTATGARLWAPLLGHCMRIRPILTHALLF
jgi:hypothetical protein